MRCPATFPSGSLIESNSLWSRDGGNCLDAQNRFWLLPINQSFEQREDRRQLKAEKFHACEFRTPESGAVFAATWSKSDASTDPKRNNIQRSYLTLRFSSAHARGRQVLQTPQIRDNRQSRHNHSIFRLYPADEMLGTAVRRRFPPGDQAHDATAVKAIAVGRSLHCLGALRVGMRSWTEIVGALAASI